MSLQSSQRRMLTANLLGLLTCILFPVLYIWSVYQAYQTGSKSLFIITLIPILGQIIWAGVSLRQGWWNFIILLIITGLIAKGASGLYEKSDEIKKKE
jgi:hypothetical protein